MLSRSTGRRRSLEKRSASRSEPSTILRDASGAPRCERLPFVFPGFSVCIGREVRRTCPTSPGEVRSKPVIGTALTRAIAHGFNPQVSTQVSTAALSGTNAGTRIPARV
jgi:hypothetical protein